MFGYAYFLYGHAHFWSINCTTPNSNLSYSLYAYISSLRYRPLKLRSTFDYCGDIARPIKSCFRHPYIRSAWPDYVRLVNENVICIMYSTCCCWAICGPICKAPTFSKIEIFVSWYSRCLQPSSVVWNTNIFLSY